jgi:hypothetical protein
MGLRYLYIVLYLGFVSGRIKYVILFKKTRGQHPNVTSCILPLRQGLRGPCLSYICGLMQGTRTISQFGKNHSAHTHFLIVIKQNIHRSLILTVVCGGELWSLGDIPCIEPIKPISKNKNMLM